MVLILKYPFWNNWSQLAACRRGSNTAANTLTHDGYGSVNITARNRQCKRVCDSPRSLLSGVQYDPLYCTSDTSASSWSSS